MLKDSRILRYFADYSYANRRLCRANDFVALPRVGGLSTSGSALTMPESGIQLNHDVVVDDPRQFFGAKPAESLSTI